MFKIHRLVVAYAIAIPMALVLGYLVATPDMASIAVVAMVIFVLLLPLLLQWCHPLLIFFWNSAFIAGFLPGQMQMWVIFGCIAFVLGVVHWFMGHRSFLRAPELTKPILFLAVVVVLTAKIRGGLGVRALGGESYGGKSYFLILLAIIGYFALTSQPIPLLKSERTVKWFFLAGTTSALTNILYALGPSTWFLYWIIPSNNLGNQIVYNWSESGVLRLSGFTTAGTFLLCFALARWGVRGLFAGDKPWRMMLAMAALVTALFGGFRSQLLFLIVLVAVQFMIEGLWRSPLMPALFLLGLLGLAPLVLFVNKLPGAVQRSLAFLPLNIDPEIRADADGSTNWRLEMWKEVLPEVPKYLLVGKGYALDPDELYLTVLATQMGTLNSYEGSIFSGDYHNGPLSILIPLGLFGAIAFTWLLGAGVKVLYGNYRYGEARLRLANITLLAYFLTQCLFFVFVFGAFSSQLSVFLGILGFSVSLNGGVCRKPAVARQPTFSSSLAAPVAVA